MPKPVSPRGQLVSGNGGSIYRFKRWVNGEVEPALLRQLECYGTPNAWTDYAPLAQDAGGLLLSLETAPTCIAAETLATDSHLDRWIWTLFDLAWSPVVGSPLASRKLVWAGRTFLPLDQVSALRADAHAPDCVRDALELIPDPPSAFYSTLDELFAASCYAIDRLTSRAKWSEVLTMKQIAVKLGLSPGAKRRTVEPRLKQLGSELQAQGRRGSYRVRLDTLDATYRAKFSPTAR